MNSDSTSLYSISDLAEQVGVPRTTITDWLGKYSRFIELQTQGRRRFYTERTLAVLCKVAEFRNAGRSIADIDSELERVFPVHPTVEPPDSAAGAEPPSEAPQSPASASAAPGAYPVVKQENSDELYDLLGAKFADLCDAMGEVERKADASARRLRLMLAIAVVTIVVLAGFLALFYAFYLVQRESVVAGKDAAAAITELSAGTADRGNAIRADVGSLAGSVSGLAGDVSGLAGGVSGMNEELQKLRADLPAQREAFEAAIAEMKKSAGDALEAQQAQFEAKIALEKEQFAAERLELLRQIDALQQRLDQAAAGEPGRAAELERLRSELATQTERGKDAEKLRSELAAASEKAEALQKRNESLAGDLAAAEKRAAEEADARKRAESEAENARRTVYPQQQNAYPQQQNNYPYQPQNAMPYQQFGFPGMQ